MRTFIKSQQISLEKLKIKYDSLCNVENKQNNTIHKLLEF